MSSIQSLQDRTVVAFRGPTPMQRKLDQIAIDRSRVYAEDMSADLVDAGFLHNVLYALSKGPLVPSEADSDYITFANGRQAAYVYLEILEDNDLTMFDDTVTLSEEGQSMLAHMDRTRGVSQLQKDDLVKARRAGFHLT